MIPIDSSFQKLQKLNFKQCFHGEALFFAEIFQNLNKNVNVPIDLKRAISEMNKLENAKEAMKKVVSAKHADKLEANINALKAGYDF